MKPAQCRVSEVTDDMTVLGTFVGILNVTHHHIITNIIELMYSRTANIRIKPGSVSNFTPLTVHESRCYEECEGLKTQKERTKLMSAKQT